MNRVGSLAIITIAGLFGAPHLAVAQTPPPRVDSVAPRARPDGAQLGPVILTYLATLRQGTDSVRALGERTVQLKSTIYAGSPAWEIVEMHGAGSNASVDTLIAEFQRLTPLHWGATQQMPTSLTTMAAARVAIEFRADSMIGVITAPSGRRTIVSPMPGGAFLTAAHLETALRGLPIGAGWRDSVAVVITEIGKTTIVAGEIGVVGEERVLTTAGTFDSWLVNLTTDVGQTQYCVSKADRIVVKTAQVLPESGDTLLYILTRISPVSNPLPGRRKLF